MTVGRSNKTNKRVEQKWRHTKKHNILIVKKKFGCPQETGKQIETA
jgi:hypothetical protein